MDGLRSKDGRDRSKRPGPLARCSNVVVTALEKAFYWLGYGIGKYPWVPLVISFILVAIGASGMSQFYQEREGDQLFVPDNSVARNDQKWIDANFPGTIRWMYAIVEAQDVLQPEVLKAMLVIDQKVKSLRTESTKKRSKSYTWDELCAKFGPNCRSNSILELWDFDNMTIHSLTSSEILSTVNTFYSSARPVSPYSGQLFVIENYLGGIVLDSSGQIISAKSSNMQWGLGHNETTQVTGTVVGIDKDFEKLYLDYLETATFSGVNNIYYWAERSSEDEGSGAILGDVNLLGIGYVLVISYVMLALGQINCLFHRVYVTIGGLVAIVLSILVAIGLASYAGWFYGPLHSVLPFLVLGLGVDDMFVIIQSLDNLPRDVQQLPVHMRIAHSLKHAGVSITVTSITDILAFGIGTVTVIPALRSFCVYICIAIFFTYIFQATFFVACVTIDELRAESGRNACCCCYQHDSSYRPNECSRTSKLQIFFERFYAVLLTKLPIKIAVIVITVGILAANIYGLTVLEQDFDPVWFIPDGSYASDYIDARAKYYPSDGLPCVLYTGNVDYYGQFSSLEGLCQDLASHKFTYQGSVDCWVENYNTWLNLATTRSAHGALFNTAGFPSNEANFYTLLQTFLADRTYGERFSVGTFRFNDTTSSSAPSIVASKIWFKQIDFVDASEEIEGMDSIRQLVIDKGLSKDQAFPFNFFFLVYEGNKVIRRELFRNIGLAFACIIATTFILLANLWVCLLVCSCVILTLVNVGGVLYFWDLTIDLVTSIQLILAVGLAVDYSAHIGYTFMTVTGSRNERMVKTLGTIGPAVFSGGFSTFLAFVLLAASNSYVFRTFFKVLFSVTLFGLWHGLVYLPVVLSWIGPDPYLSATEPDKEEEHYATHNGGLGQTMEHPTGQLNGAYQYDRHRHPAGPYPYEGPTLSMPRPTANNHVHGTLNQADFYTAYPNVDNINQGYTQDPENTPNGIAPQDAVDGGRRVQKWPPDNDGTIVFGQATQSNMPFSYGKPYSNGLPPPSSLARTQNYSWQAQQPVANGIYVNPAVLAASPQSKQYNKVFQPPNQMIMPPQQQQNGQVGYTGFNQANMHWPTQVGYSNSYANNYANNWQGGPNFNESQKHHKRHKNRNKKQRSKKQ